MELWIRSQDKRQLLKVNDGLFIASDINDTFIGLKNIGHIGRYTTEERALEILDEIQKLLEPKVETKLKSKVTFDGDEEPICVYVPCEEFSCVEQLSTYVYQMPEE